MKSYALICLAFSRLLFATTCYTDCPARFPKWYQEPDRKRCQAEKALACTESSGLPGPTRLSKYDTEFDSYAKRLAEDFTEGGYIVSRRSNGEAMHQGDSLLWTSLAMAALPCDKAKPLRDAITSSIEKNSGRIIRFEPLPKSYKGNETSRDAEVGAIFGFAMHARQCPQAKPQLARAWKLHRKFVEKEGKLHNGSNPNFYMTPSIRFAWDLASHELLGTAKPSTEALRLFESAVLIGTKNISSRKESCYPVHLNTLMIILAKKLGKPVNHFTRREFCHETRGMNLPLTEWYCVRGDTAAFLKDFRIDTWEYRHQRCPKWESPDVDPGEESPAVDYLIYKTVVELG